MQESKLLAPLLPSSSDFLPIVNEMRRKYQLPELNPDDEPIKEIFLNGEPVALQDPARRGPCPAAAQTEGLICFETQISGQTKTPPFRRYFLGWGQRI